MTWNQRFAELAEKKTREAVSAELPAYVTEAESPGGDLVPIGDDWTRKLFDGPFYVSPPPAANGPACSLVFVQSLDGNTGARNPSALGGGKTDKHLIYEGLSRVAADAVLAGAGTIRDGEIVFSVWHPELVRVRTTLGKPRHPVQIVATLEGLDLDHELLFNVPEVPVILLTVNACTMLMGSGLASRPWITPLVMEGPNKLRTAFERLRALGIERISCVGGRKVATRLIDAGLVQDVYLTTAPRPGGEPHTPLHQEPLDARVVVRKRGTGVESGVVFEHLRLTSGSTASSSRRGSRTGAATTSR